MAHYVASDLGLHCLLMTLLRVSPVSKNGLIGHFYFIQLVLFNVEYVASHLMQFLYCLPNNDFH